MLTPDPHVDKSTLTTKSGAPFAFKVYEMVKVDKGVAKSVFRINYLHAWDASGESAPQATGWVTKEFEEVTW